MHARENKNGKKTQGENEQRMNGSWRRTKKKYALVVHATTIVRSSYTWTHDNSHFTRIVRKTNKNETSERRRRRRWFFLSTFLNPQMHRPVRIVFVLQKLSRFNSINVTLQQFSVFALFWRPPTMLIWSNLQKHIFFALVRNNPLDGIN